MLKKTDFQVRQILLVVVITAMWFIFKIKKNSFPAEYDKDR